VRRSPNRVAVLMGGESAEREVSLMSGTGVMQALGRLGIPAVSFDPREMPLSELKGLDVSAAFLALHGRFGEDGTVQGALEWLGLPYTGSGVMASAIAMDKPMTKRIWRAEGIPTPKFLRLTGRERSEGVIAELGLPLAIKPAREGSSLGFTKLERVEDFDRAVDLARRYDDGVLAEAFVGGREFTVALLGDESGEVQALPVIEIVAPQGNYDYQNKYFGEATRYICPAPVPVEIAQQMQSLSLRAFHALECEGWARVDILWDGVAEPMLLEINTCPGLTDHSLVPMAAKAAGFSYDQLVLRILSGARLKLKRETTT